MHRLAADDARRLDLHAALRVGCDRALAVDRLTERVHDAADERVADGHREDAAGGLDRLALLDVVALAEDHRTDGLLVEVQRETEQAALELEQLVDRGVGQAGDAGDAVAHLEDPAELLLRQRRARRTRRVVAPPSVRLVVRMLASALIVSSAMRQIVPLSCSSR